MISKEAADGEARTRLARVLRDACVGCYPAWDGHTELLPAPLGATGAILTFTGHNIVAADIDGEWLASRCGRNDLVAPLRGRFLAEMERRLGAEQGPLDLVLVAPALTDATDLDITGLAGPGQHPRLQRAARVRSKVSTYAVAGGAAVLAVGQGLAGRWEAGFEVSSEGRGQGLGRRLALTARHLIPPGEFLFLQVAAGNVASLRAALAAGFTPIGAEILFGTGGPPPQ